MLLYIIWQTYNHKNGFWVVDSFLFRIIFSIPFAFIFKDKFFSLYFLVCTELGLINLNSNSVTRERESSKKNMFEGIWKYNKRALLLKDLSRNTFKLTRFLTITRCFVHPQRRFRVAFRSLLQLLLKWSGCDCYVTMLKRPLLRLSGSPLYFGCI